jgi:biopolymer transport protein ExbB
MRLGTAQVALAAVAPLLGLLGTVSGMISTFDVITELGAGNPKLLSGGISEALVTTKFGLLVAIPGVLAANLLNARATAVLAACETAAIGLLEAGKARDVA